MNSICDGCSVYKWCGTTVSSIKLCNSIHKGFEDIDKQIKEINNEKDKMYEHMASNASVNVYDDNNFITLLEL